MAWPEAIVVVIVYFPVVVSSLPRERDRPATLAVSA
jgi:hypothetical protein